MILSTRFRRTIRRALTLEAARRPDRPDRDDVSATTETGRLLDPDWAIREIVDEVMFETAR